MGALGHVAASSRLALSSCDQVNGSAAVTQATQITKAKSRSSGPIPEEGVVRRAMYLSIWASFDASVPKQSQMEFFTFIYILLQKDTFQAEYLSAQLP